ncbi:MAG: TonB-dependent receptor plug domain-containing protein [Sphingomonas sp.]|uniref:TonB-dependent receptor plug domain-containing protein n=1 Tax=Sphingomonas sp. TaxID=28214 RepID=UPI0026159959|nr:TonB-dependent receptor [Sphingomonas sp.]MDK2767158.1 TonB-dependent receptor plug domain-containing protein [Sphingomonas sp.]
MKSILTSLAGASIATIALATAAPALAQDAPAAADDGIETAEEIVVKGTIAYRNRSEGAEPELVYDQDFFQRFEPLTAGDALKRVPSVTFLSDVIESDGARLRGLDPGYTQILINGEKVPGTNADRSFFLDRIPAELVKQVEIVRSSSARRTGDAVAGTLNIVLRDGYQLDGGYIRGGALYFDDGKVKPSIGAVFGTEVGPGRLLIGANLQGRYNPKKKFSLRYGDSPENDPNYATNEFDNRQDQSDVRNGTDYALNASYSIDTETTDFELSGFWVHTDRLETERSFDYSTETGSRGSVRNGAGGNLQADNSNINNIIQYNYSLAAKLSHEWAAGETKLKAGFAKFIDDQWETENEIEFDRSAPRFTGDRFDTRIVDKELSFGLEHKVPAGEGFDIVFGGFYQDKDRDTRIVEATRQRFNMATSLHTGYSQFSGSPESFVGEFTGFAPILGGFSTIEEQRKDLFALVEGKSGAIKWEVGVRWENTNVAIRDLTPGGASIDTDYNHLLPSASAKIELGDGRVTISGARTVRRPRFDDASPVLLEEELGDNDFLGNPLLKPESAWGADLGYEHRLGRTGVIGVNIFYRSISDLIELANTGVPGAADDPTGDRTWVYQPRNTGDGTVYGVEFDVSTSLGFLGLPDTGVFGNLSLLESDITDELGERRFNGQSNIVYNFGFIQDIPSFGAAFGATYRKQGAAYDRFVAEEVRTTYGADLEIFVEKRFGKRFTIRAVGSNLLDGAKAESFNKFNTTQDQIDRNFDEYELERETAGPVFQVMARLAF